MLMSVRAVGLCAITAAMLLVGVGCATQPAALPPPAPPDPDAAAISAALSAEHRSAANRARDAYRHPLETLLFFGIKPDSTVVEVWPGATGWYTEVLAPLLAERGKLYTPIYGDAPDNPFVAAGNQSFREKLAARPDLYGKVEITALWTGSEAIAPPGSADLVLTFRNLHNWMARGMANEAIAAMQRALKPGGILGVVEHRGIPGKPQDPKAATGYVDEQYAVELIQAAGFELVERSEINANPRDTKDYAQGVWTLPPNYRLGERDREKYTAIGESDRFTLKFRKR
jgi:predicted methyltransferase